jgi:uncharacterized protein (TIGR02466 family)
MTRAVETCFPTFVYRAPLGGRTAARNRDLLEDAYKLREVDDAGQRWCKKNYPVGYTSYASQNHLHRTFSAFRDLELLIRRHVRRFARRLDLDLQGGRLEMTDCWVNVMPRFAVHGLHLHPLSVVSGTYYVRTPPGCSRIRFEDPRLSRLMNAPPRKADCRPENRQQVSLDVRAGQVVLFESWLRHEVASNGSATPRVSISFNYDWVRG